MEDGFLRNYRVLPKRVWKAGVSGFTGSCPAEDLPFSPHGQLTHMANTVISQSTLCLRDLMKSVT